MHKKGLLFEIALLGVLLLAAAWLSMGGILAQNGTTPLEKQMETLESTASDLRGLDELKSVERYFPTRDELSAFLTKSFDEQLTDDVLRRETLFYVAFDLLPPDVDLYQEYLDLYQAQVGGYYEPETGRMNVILVSGNKPGDSLPLLEQIMYVHEFVHALQDQHFDLRKIGLDAEAESVEVDSVLAVQGLIEGDATMVMNDYTIQVAQENPLSALIQILLQGVQTGGLTLPPGTPDVIAAELLFPYFDGLAFAQKLHHEGGWELINRAYTGNLPQSTEQILHPERYLVGDAPVAVMLTPVEDALGSGWESALERTMGEFYLRQYLLTQLDNTTVTAAAAGWGGDRFGIYTNAETGQRAWVMRIVWDTLRDAEEFMAAYDTFGGARFPLEALHDSCWMGDADALCTITEDSQTIIAYAPDVDMAQAFLDTQG